MKTLRSLILLVPGLGLAVATACAPSSSGSGDIRGGSSSGDVGPLRAGDEAEIPCAPRAVLKAVCQQCHARPAENGAPFPLEERSDVLRTYGGVVVRELMIEQLQAKRMPLGPVTISDADRATLLAWVRAGAPAVPPETCAPDAGAAPEDAGTSSEPDAAQEPDAGEPPGEDSGTPDEDSGL